MFKTIGVFLMLCGCVYGQQMMPVPPMPIQPMPYQGVAQPLPMAPQTVLPSEWRNGLRETWTNTNVHEIKPIQQYEQYQGYYQQGYPQQLPQYYPQGQYYYPQYQQGYCQPQYQCYPEKRSWIPYFMGGN
jgi:hypothetical protein